MPYFKPSLNRRLILKLAGFAGAASVASAWAQPGSIGALAKNIVVAQVVDVSQAQQDVSKDFLIGSRAAWQDINLRGGIRGRKVNHLTLETDGTPTSIRTALDTIKANPACVAVSGSVGDQVASSLVTLLRTENLNIPHVAPWLQNASPEVDNTTFPIFAARQEQISYSLKNLSVMGIKELGAVYGTASDHTAFHLEVEKIAASMQLKLQSFQGSAGLRELGQQLTSQTPAVLLFVGGTPELSQFTQGLAKQTRQRYVVALADVNLQTMQQMGASRNTSVIATQPVPMVTAGLIIVRQYRETLARLFDEPPTALSLAGFIAARYTFEVLNGVDSPLSRQSALAAFQRRAAMDLGGFRISFNPQGRSSTYVTQSMMTLDGRVIG